MGVAGRRPVLRGVACGIAAIILIIAVDFASAAEETVFRHVSVVDVAAGRAIGDRDVTVRDGHIVAVRKASKHVARGARVIDGRACWLIPGLWDMHVHALFDSTALATFVPAMLAEGITGFRDMGGRLELLAQFRAASRNGEPVPLVVASGPWLDGPKPVDPNVGLAIVTPDQARRAVDSLAAAGVDFIKVYTGLDREPFLATLDEARRRGLPVAGHIPHGIADEEAATLGMRSVEHMRAETGCYAGPDSIAACDRLLGLFRAHETWQTPTVVARRARARAADSTLGRAPAFDVVPASLRAEWEATRRAKLARRPPAYFAGLPRDFAKELWLAGRIYRDSVPMLAGSDCGADFVPPGAGLHDELALWVEAGIPAAAALRAATLGAARFLGRADTLGTIAHGNRADVVLLAGNPLADIHATRRVRGVMLGGRWLDRAALDSLRAGAVAAARR